MKFRLTPDWHKKNLRCFFCDEDRSVKYEMDFHDKTVHVCNKCVLKHNMRLKKREHKLNLTWHDKVVSIDYPVVDGHIEYALEGFEQTKLYEFLKAFQCINHVDPYTSITPALFYIHFNYDTPDEIIKEICEKAIEMIWEVNKC